MGCLPVLLLFPLGFGLGYLFGGASGSLWGAGIGLLLGLGSMAVFVRGLRRRHQPPKA